MKTRSTLPLPKTTEIGLSGIAVKPERLRALRPEVVDELAASMTVNGLLQALAVRPRKGAGYWLIAGRHRFEAARKLKWTSIRCTVFDDMDATAAELAEIDENLIRADLTPAERAAHQAARKAIYERIHPGTKRGAGPQHGKGTKGGRLKSQNETQAYIDDAAKKTNRSRATVAREVHRGEKIPDVADLAGTSLDKADELDALAKLAPKEQRVLIKAACKGKKVTAKIRLKQIRRNERERELAGKIVAMPTKKYGVIVEDYEWDFQVRNRDTGMDRHAANHYPVSEDAHTAEEIVARTKNRFACTADDCALFMWTTVPHLAIGIDVLRLRGFRYVSNWAWDKIKIGTGYWNRNRHEHLLLGIKGTIPCPAPGEQWESLLSIEAGDHSAKPERFLEMIEAYFPTLPKIELNLRGAPRPGWDGWGYEAQEQEAAE
jgi:N6-adenosine-specific RNA methylase IME4